jgi:hypothetical protein
VAEEGKGFFGRWARRKAAALENRPLEPERATEGMAFDAGAVLPANAAEVSPPVAQPARPALGPAQSEPALSLDDVKFLTKDSDFKPFMAKGVGPEVRNAAMKKLFADPHFNVMDGLDTYIDDYSKSDPIPEAMLRQMTGASVLGLFDEEKVEEKGSEIPDPAMTRQDANNPRQQSMTELGETTVTTNPFSADSSTTDLSPGATGSTCPIASQEDHANTDLRLQPDHAATTQNSGCGT